ncbi:hypothetical protein QJS04_geneDACA007983 [Acorus gramineus]|uniref:Uncharacterized protein n=1 Tax=Acorus gramineus TaxID=55184 RepID=A0AAV9BDL6_ACOGR|nr:hypothetical protein QJS04_geneDACA007983 [Acorus gramineus]
MAARSNLVVVVLVVVVVLLMVVMTMSETTVVVAPWALDGASCNGSIAECNGEEEELLLAVGESENGLRRLLQGGQSISYGALDRNKHGYSKSQGEPYSGNGCSPYDHCRVR